MSSKGKDKLDSLKGGGRAAAKSESRGGPIFVVRDTKADPDGYYDHTGPAIVQAGESWINILPGLNILDAGTTLDVEAAGCTETDAELTGFAGVGALRALAEQTQQPEALEHMLRLELAKPVTASAGKRRNRDLVGLLEKRLAFASRQPPLNVSDLHTQAHDQAMVARAPTG